MPTIMAIHIPAKWSANRPEVKAADRSPQGRRAEPDRRKVETSTAAGQPGRLARPFACAKTVRSTEAGARHTCHDAAVTRAERDRAGNKNDKERKDI